MNRDPASVAFEWGWLAKEEGKSGAARRRPRWPEEIRTSDAVAGRRTFDSSPSSASL